jgi:serine/threonine-protein kinase RsbW
MDERSEERVAPRQQVRLALHRHSAPRTARSQIRRVCAAAMPRHVCETAELLTSELVTNAVMHGEGLIRLAVFLDAARLRVEVSDDSPTRPQLREAGAGDTGGRGLQFVDSWALAWGATPRPDRPGKDVWFTLDVS